MIIENKGMFDISESKHIGFSTSIFDITDGSDKKMPVISYINEMREEDSVFYQHIIDVGTVEPFTGFTKWVKVGGVLFNAL